MGALPLDSREQWEHLLYQEVTTGLFHFHEAKPRENYPDNAHIVQNIGSQYFVVIHT